MAHSHGNWRWLLVMLLGASACRPSVFVLGNNEQGKPHGADIMEAVAVHLTREGTDDAFGPYQERLTREVLAPSGLYADDKLWTRKNDARRTLHFAGSMPKGQRYRMDPHVVDPPFKKIGDSRFAFGLSRRASDEFVWDTLDEYRIGSLDIHQVIPAIHTTFEAPAHANGGNLLPEVLRDFPKAGQSFGRMMSLQRLEGMALPDGSALGWLVIKLDPDRARANGFPHFADYLERYVDPMELQSWLTDRHNVPLVEMNMKDNVLVMHWRTVNGHFVPLAGTSHAPPDRWRIRFAIRSKVLFMNVGARDVYADVDEVDEAGEIGWDLHFNREPGWEFPPGVLRLLGGSLKRPFEGDGVRLRLTLRQEGGHTVASRKIHAVLKESALIRWAGRLVAAIGEDFVERTQAEGYRFFQQGSAAYREDILSVAESGRGPVN